MKQLEKHVLQFAYKASWSIVCCVMLVALPVLLLGQPGLPDTLEQASIDDGSGILAALGGGYIIKKLRNRKRRRGTMPFINKI